jgi:hypothetical protein
VDEQGEQLLATWRRAGERFPQRGVALGPRQFLLGDLGVLVRDAAGAGYRGGSRLRSPSLAERSGHRSRQVSGRTPDSTHTHRPLLSHAA